MRVKGESEMACEVVREYEEIEQTLTDVRGILYFFYIFNYIAAVFTKTRSNILKYYFFNNILIYWCGS